MLFNLDRKFSPESTLHILVPALLISRCNHVPAARRFRGHDHSIRSKPRFLSPSNVSIASKRRDRSISHGRKFSLTSRTKTMSSASR